MYIVVLILHSWLRWAAFGAGILAVLAHRGSAADDGGRAERWGLIFMMTLDIQMLLGLVLYLVLSPTTMAILENFGGAMRDPAARFWAVEHETMMMFAVVVVHVGRVLARKAASPAIKRSRMMLCLIAALVAMVVATPWPGLPNGRPLFRFSAVSSAQSGARI
jgi:cytochrome c biogenesis factor